MEHRQNQATNTRRVERVIIRQNLCWWLRGNNYGVGKIGGTREGFVCSHANDCKGNQFAPQQHFFFSEW